MSLDCGVKQNQRKHPSPLALVPELDLTWFFFLWQRSRWTEVFGSDPFGVWIPVEIWAVPKIASDCIPWHITSGWRTRLGKELAAALLPLLHFFLPNLSWPRGHICNGRVAPFYGIVWWGLMGNSIYKWMQGQWIFPASSRSAIFSPPFITCHNGALLVFFWRWSRNRSFAVKYQFGLLP